MRSASTPPNKVDALSRLVYNTRKKVILKRVNLIVFAVQVPSQTEEYLDSKAIYTRGWEQDRFQLSQMLRKPQLIENPKKPLLLLVTKEGEDNDIDIERIINLLDLGRLQRPIRAVVHSSSKEDSGNLKEALDWLAKTANAKDNESTAVTGSDTEEEGSVVTSTSTALSLAQGGHYVLDYEPTLLAGNATLQRFEPIKKGTHCPFSRAAKLWGGKLPDEHTPKLLGRPPDEVLVVASLNAGPLAEFVVRSSNGEPLDGFCLQLPRYGCRFKSLGHCVCKLLTKLAELDPSPGENAMQMGPIDHPH